MISKAFEARAAGFSGQTCVRDADLCHQDGGSMIRCGFGFAERGSGAREKGPAILSAQHAREEAEAAGGKFVEDATALGNAKQALMGGIGDPHGAFCVEANSVGSDREFAEGAAVIG